MKKNFMWTMAALFVSGLAFTACQVEDNPNPYPEQGNIEDLWDKTSTSYDFEDGNTVFTAASRMSVEIRDNAEKGSKVLAFVNAKNTQNGYGFCCYDMTEQVAQATKVTVKFDYYNGNGRGCITIGDALVRGANGAGAGMDRINKAPFYGAKGAIFRVGASSDGKSYVVNDDVLGAAADWCNKWLTVEVGVYNFDRQVEWVIKNGDEILAQSGTTEGEGDDAVFTPGKVDFWQADANEATQIDVFGFVNNNVSFIDNLSIVKAKDPTIKFVDYKIRYVDADGKDLKEARVANGRDGGNPVLIASDSASFYLDEAGKVTTEVAKAVKKKIYASTNVKDVKIAENAEVLMTFRDADTYYAVLKCQSEDGIALETFNDANKYKFFEGDNFVMYPPTGYYKNGSCYFATKTDNNGVQVTLPGTYNPTVAGGKTYYIATLNYAKDANAVYFADFERLALPTVDAGNGTGLGQLEGTVNSWISYNNAYFTRFSGGCGIRLDANSYVWTEPIAASGTFTVTIYGRNDIYYKQTAYNVPQPYILGIRKANGEIEWKTDLAIPDWAGSVTGTSVVENVTINSGESLVVKYDGSTVEAEDGTQLKKEISFDSILLTIPAAE